MIACDLIGRMGNQMFQIATTIALSIENECQFVIPEFSLNRAHWPNYFTHFPKVPEEYEPSVIYREDRNFKYAPIPYTPGMKIHGYFQSEKYFAAHRETIIKAFGFSWVQMHGITGIHIRRGDYVKLADKHPPVPYEYTRGSVTAIRDTLYVSRQELLVFSDDIQWCKEHKHELFPDGIRVMFAEGSCPIADMVLLSCCENQIISNSTFSWWAAWLNQNPRKMVISPSAKNWFGPGNAHLDASDIIPESWIKIEY